MYTRDERAKICVLGLLLLLMLGFLVFSTASTFQAVHSFQKQYGAVHTGDVSTIHPWMTLHVISHIYNVPEDYLYSSLQISSTKLPFRHTSLYEIATLKKQSTDQVIHTIQHAILTYRNEHHHFPPPKVTPSVSPPRTDRKPLLFPVGRTHY